MADPEDVYDSVYVRVQLEQTLTLGGEDVPQASPTNISSNQYPGYVEWAKDGEIKTIDDWYDAGSLSGEYWVQDSDGWLYWAHPLEFGEETTHILDTVKLLVAPVGGLNYTVNVKLEAVSSDLEDTAVIADYEGGFDAWEIEDTDKIMPLFKNDHSYEIGYETLIMSATGTQELTLSMLPNNKVMPTVAGQTFADPETGTLWRVLVPTNAEGNALIITERVYNYGVQYNTTNVWTLYESSNLKTNATTGMDAWYSNETKVGTTLRGIALDYAYQDASGLLPVNKLDTGAGVEMDANGVSFNASATATKAITKAGAIGIKGTENASVFALSITEANTYFSNDATRKAYDVGGTVRAWWLRSPGNASNPGSAVYTEGHVDGLSAAFTMIGLRPALWINP